MSCFDLIYHSFCSNKLGHAFLIETNNIPNALIDLNTLLKKLNCPHEYSEKCEYDCNLCFLIDNDLLPSKKVVESKTTMITKDQISEIKHQFLSNSMFSKYNSYIVKNAERLNDSAANILLKFLEEPDTNTLAFFITGNAKSVLPTIKSRCQIYKALYDENKYNTKNEEYSALIIKSVENFKINFATSAVFLKQDYQNLAKNKNELLEFLLTMLNYYQNLLNEDIKNHKNVILLSKCIQTIQKSITNLNYNVNIELFIDNFLMEMGGIYNEYIWN